MNKKSIIKIVDFLNQKTYHLYKMSKSFEYFSIDKLVLPPKELFVYIHKYFNENDYKRLGFKYAYPDMDYYDIDKNKVLHIETADGLMIKDSDWSNYKMEQIASFSTLDDFWSFFIKDNNWYKKYLLKIDIDKSEPPFYKRISDTCNKLKKDTLNTEKEIELLYQCWEYKIRRDYLNNYCPICKKEIHYNPRFPMSLCPDCENRIVDEQLKPLKIGKFSDLYYEDGTRYNSQICYVDNVKCEVIYYMGHEVIIFEE